MKRVLVTDAVAEEGLEILRRAEGIEVDVRIGAKGTDLLEAIKDAHALIVRSATKVTGGVLEAAERLEVVGRAGVGVDNVDTASATKRGVLVMNTPGGSAITTAEHAITLLMALARNVPQATASTKAGRWEKSRFKGREVTGKVLGILGVGNIGKVVASRAQGLKMQVLAYDPFLSAEAAARLDIKLVSFEELLAESDFLTVHAPLTDKTRGMLGAAAFAQVKPGVLLVNCARGGIVDEAALADALRDGRVAGAALDVFSQEPPGESPLFGLDNFICTPHLGASTGEAQVAVSVAIAEQVVDYLTHGVLRNAVNFPALSREQLELLGPYLAVAEKIGTFVAQAHPGSVEKVYALYDGAVAAYDLSAVTSAFLKGLLGTIFDTAVVNHVNARVLARERGIEVIEAKSARAKDYTSLLTLRAVGGGHETLVAGTLFGKSEPRVVRVNEFALEVIPEGHAILLHNLDRPGVIGAIGTLLGSREINISRMQLGLDPARNEALSVWNIDAPAGPEVLGEIAALPNTLSAKALYLG